MRQSATTQSPTPALQPKLSAGNSPHSVLQTALASLDVQLEEELMRYRRQRALGKADYKPRPPAYRKVTQALGSISAADVSEPLPAQANPFNSENFHPTADVPPLVAIAPSSTPMSPSSAELKELAKQYASQVADQSDLSAAAHGSPDDYLESSEELLRTLSEEEAKVQAEQGFMQSLLTPLGVGSMLLLLLSSAMFGFVIMNPSSVSQLFARRSTHPSVAPNQPNLPAESADSAGVPQPNLANQEFPELNLDTLGSVKVNEDGMPTAPVGTTNPESAAKSAHLGISGNAGVAAAPGVAIVPPTPRVNDSAPEAAPPGDVPSPRKLAPARSYSPPARSYSPPVRAYTPPARSYAPPQSYNLPPVRVTPMPVKPVPLAPQRSTTPSTSDRTPPPPSSAASTTSTPSNTRVVAPYTSDSALEEARRKVPDAYVKNYPDGAKVQFGSYQDEAAAKAQVEELRKQGIPAEVYKP